MSDAQTTLLTSITKTSEPKKIKRSYNLDAELVTRLSETASRLEVTQTHLLDKLLTYGLDQLKTETS